MQMAHTPGSGLGNSTAGCPVWTAGCGRGQDGRKGEPEQEGSLSAVSSVCCPEADTLGLPAHPGYPLVLLPFPQQGSSSSVAD